MADTFGTSSTKSTDDTGLLSVRGSTVIDPDGGVHKRGNWDDVVQNTHSTAEAEEKLLKKDTPTTSKMPSDIWEEQGTEQHSDDKHPQENTTDSSDTTTEDTEEHPKIVKHKSADAEEPVQVAADSAHTTADPAPVAIDTTNDTESTSSSVNIELSTSADSETPDLTIAQSQETEDEHELELQETLSGRLVRYGKTAVTSLVLPLVNPKITANMLTGRHEEPVTADPPSLPATTTTQKRSIRFISPAAAASQETVTMQTKDEHLLDIVSGKLGIGKNEALARLHAAVDKANQDAATRATAPGTKYTGRPTPVARAVTHNPPTDADNEIGVFIDTEGGRALSFNPKDVLQVLGQYLN